MTARPIAGVSETARWVAAYRARESARPDALFCDPYAARLAGQRGEEIAQTVAQPGATGNGWPVITRTKLIDDMIIASIEDGCTCVLNLAAGFDTRPYRLDLPPTLLWIEADLPEILDEKERELAGEQPRCVLERVSTDLADGAQRAELFDRIDAKACRVLVVAEGLVVYLEEALVAALGRDLVARSTFAYWALDFSSPAMLRLLQRGRTVDLASAPLRFGPPDGVTFFEALGWRAVDVRSLFHEGVRLRRVPWLLRPFAMWRPPDARAPGEKRWSGVVRFARAAAHAHAPAHRQEHP